MKKCETVAILGEGSWGTAIATVLAANGHSVALWCHHEDVVDQINNSHENKRYMPGIALAPSIKATASLREVLEGATWVFEALPVKHLRSVLTKMVDIFSPEQVWGILSKGIEQETLLVPSQIIDDVFGTPAQKVVFSGPSFAYELIRKQSTSGALVATDCSLAYAAQALLKNDYFFPVIASDFLGVQAGGALKNVFTLGIGMLQGAGFGDNAQACLLSESVQEMASLTVALGGMPETVYGLSGLGDLVLTAMGEHSKNVALGRRLGKGEKLAAISSETGTVPEGISTVVSINQMRQKKSIHAPLAHGIYRVIYEDLSVASLVHETMERLSCSPCNGMSCCSFR